DMDMADGGRYRGVSLRRRVRRRLRPRGQDLQPGRPDPAARQREVAAQLARDAAEILDDLQAAGGDAAALARGDVAPGAAAHDGGNPAQRSAGHLLRVKAGGRGPLPDLVQRV